MAGRAQQKCSIRVLYMVLSPCSPMYRPTVQASSDAEDHNPVRTFEFRPRFGLGTTAHVAKEVAAIKGVTSAEDVTGPYDVIVRAEARNVDELGKLVVAKIQAVEGITRTLTCPVVHL